MLKTFKVVAGAAALVCASVSSQAGGLVVDLFNTDQTQLINNTNGTTIWNQLSGIPDAIGGWRELGVEKISGDSGDVAKIGVANGLLKFSSDTSVAGRGTVRWDGGSTVGVRDFNLGANLSAFTAGSFELLTVFADLGFQFSLSAYTDAGNYATITLLSNAHNTALPGDASYIPLAAFADCGFSGGGITVTCVGAGVNWANVGALEAVINSDGAQLSVDLSLNQVTAQVPEPGSLALVGLALLGIGAVRRRRA